MACRSQVGVGLPLVAAALVIADVPAAFASGEPQESFLYQNFVRASAALDRAVAAHGGAELLDRAVDVRFAFTGTYRLEGHFARPWAHKDYRLEGVTLYSSALQALKVETTFYDGDRALPSFVIAGPTNGLQLDGGGSKPDSIPGDELESSLRQELEVLPHEYLRQARACSASLRMLSGARGFEVLAYSLESGEDRALYLASKTHLLMRVERIGHWKHKGDRLEWRTFADYVERSGIRVPLHSQVHVEDSSGQHDIITELTKIETGSSVSAEDLAIPAAYRAGLEAWTLQPPAPKDEGPLPVHDLGKGAYIIELPPSDARSLLVAFADFSVVVEAGDYSEISARILATADSVLPDKPVRYVTMTHHHPLYANGLRPYVQRGITVLTTAGNVDYYRDLAERPYRIHPDAQQREPHKPKVEVIDGTRVIEDKQQRLELHEYDYSTHVDEFVLPYLPSHKLIVTADQVYIVRDDELRPANVRELAIDRVVRERGLDVQSIMQTWYLKQSDTTVRYSVLQEKVRLAEEKASKK